MYGKESDRSVLSSRLVRVSAKVLHHPGHGVQGEVKDVILRLLDLLVEA